MKSLISVFIIICVLSLCLFGCSTNIPEEPAQTYSNDYSYVNPIGASEAPAGTKSEEGQTEGVKYVQTINNVEIVLEDYYVFGKSAAKITDITFDDFGIGNVNGYADVEMIAIGRRSDDMRIAYTAYDKDGTVVRGSYILAKLDDKSVKEGSVCEDRRFDFPREAVKIVFSSYVADE